jgi:nucleoside-diphosphate-sugar epimerase
VPVTVLLRDGRAEEKFVKMGCSVVLGDVTVPGSLQRASAQCSHAVHCAVGGSSLAQARRINVEGTINLLTACEEAGVSRVVYLSSVAAHGRRWPPILREGTPLCTSGDAYALSKAESERRLMDAARESSVAATIVRPSIVYGPGAARILDLLDRVRYGRIRLIDHGQGLLNLVHVDDLVDGILKLSFFRARCR